MISEKKLHSHPDRNIQAHHPNLQGLEDRVNQVFHQHHLHLNHQVYPKRQNFIFKGIKLFVVHHNLSSLEIFYNFTLWPFCPASPFTPGSPLWPGSPCKPGLPSAPAGPSGPLVPGAPLQIKEKLLLLKNSTPVFFPQAFNVFQNLYLPVSL